MNMKKQTSQELPFKKIKPGAGGLNMKYRSVENSPVKSLLNHTYKTMKNIDFTPGELKGYGTLT